MSKAENPNELLDAWDDLADKFEAFARLFLGDEPAEKPAEKPVAKPDPEPERESPFEVVPEPEATPVAEEAPAGPPETPRTVKVGIIVGHKPSRPGATNQRYRMSEYTFNSALAEAIVSILKRSPWIKPFVIFRQPDSYSKLPAKVNATGVEFAISLHANAYDKSATGTEVLYYEGSPKGKELARILQSSLLLALGLANRGIKPRDEEDRGGTLLRYTSMPCVIAEPFFIDNDGDLIRARDRWTELATAYADAIEQYGRTLAL